jgi:segregation and condensation protein A
MPSQSVLNLDLDLDLFSGPFDLLLTLVLRDDVELSEVAIAEICVSYLEHVGGDATADLEAMSEFLVLVAALCELKSRLLLPGEELGDVEDALEAADELAARLAEYARARAAAEWLRRRREEVGRRLFRATAPALRAPRPLEQPLPPGDPAALVAAIARLLAPPPTPDIGHLPRRLLPVRDFLDRFRRLLDERGTFTFDDACSGLDRMGQAVAFWALLDLYKRGELRMAQVDAFAPIRIARASGLLVEREGEAVA